MARVAQIYSRMPQWPSDAGVGISGGDGLSDECWNTRACCGENGQHLLVQPGECLNNKCCLEFYTEEKVGLFNTSLIQER